MGEKGLAINPVDKRILKFIQKHHIFTLATCYQGKPWTATCFYVYRPQENLFIFTTDLNTVHGTHMLENPSVAGSIALETSVIGKIQGIQFTGKTTALKDHLLKIGKQTYWKRFPVAAFMDTFFWGLEPDLIKMTDNRLGFGKKLIWYGDAETLSKSI